MKKGLLSLLAVALTIVSCQNYDDQFAELTGLVNTLSTDVAGLSQVQTDLGTLSTLVGSLKTAIDADFTSIEGDIEELEQLLTNVADSEDLGNVVELLNGLQEKVNTLLEADAVINQNITINNSATLEYVGTLINHSEDDPNVIINGWVRIDTTLLTATETTEANLIAAKLATVLNYVDLTSATPITLTHLAFVDGDYIVTGSDMDDAALRTVTGDLNADHGGVAQAFDYSQLSSVGGNLIMDPSDAATATSINLLNVNITGTVNHGGGAGLLTFPNADVINLGTAGWTTLVAAKATDIDAAGTAANGNIDITALATATIDIGLTTATGTLDVYAPLSVFKANSLVTVTGNSSVTAVQSWFNELTTQTGTLDVDATVGAYGKLANITSATDFGSTPTPGLSALASTTAAITWNPVAGVINWDGLDVDAGGSIISTTASVVTVKAIDNFTQLPDAKHITLDGQNADVAISDGLLDVTTNLTVNKDTTLATMIEFSTAADFVTADEALRTVALSGVDTVTIADTAITSLDMASSLYIDLAATSKVVTATTSGDIIRFISASDALAAWNNTANVKDDLEVLSGEEAVTVDIQSSLLTTVDLSSMNKVRVVNLPASNAALVTAIAPSTDNLLTAGANPSITIEFSSTVTYTEATLKVADGVNATVEFIEGHLHAPGAATWADYITAISVVNSPVTVSLDFATVIGIDNAGAATTHADMSAAFAADGANTDNTADGRGGVADTTVNAGVISTALELSIISATGL